MDDGALLGVRDLLLLWSEGPSRIRGLPLRLEDVRLMKGSGVVWWDTFARPGAGIYTKTQSNSNTGWARRSTTATPDRK